MLGLFCIQIASVNLKLIVTTLLRLLKVKTSRHVPTNVSKFCLIILDNNYKIARGNARDRASLSPVTHWLYSKSVSFIVCLYVLQSDAVKSLSKYGIIIY